MIGNPVASTMLRAALALMLAEQPMIAVSAAGAAVSSEHAVRLIVGKGRLLSGPRIIRVNEGDRVSLTILSDRKDVLHLHGYDVQVPLTPDKAASLRLIARLTGRFSYELHKSDQVIGFLEVYPR